MPGRVPGWTAPQRAGDLPRIARMLSDAAEHFGALAAAVIAAIVVMEESPLFNAGKGAVFNAAGDLVDVEQQDVLALLVLLRAAEQAL